MFLLYEILSFLNYNLNIFFILKITLKLIL